MPGKQVGISGTCYLDCLINSLLSAYLYVANNPSEATVASAVPRYSATVSYTSPLPPAENTGLYKRLKELYQGLRENEGRGPTIINYIVSAAWTCDLDKDIDDLPDPETYDAKTNTVERHDEIALERSKPRSCRSRAVSSPMDCTLLVSLSLPMRPSLPSSTLPSSPVPRN